MFCITKHFCHFEPLCTRNLSYVQLVFIITDTNLPSVQMHTLFGMSTKSSFSVHNKNCILCHFISKQHRVSKSSFIQSKLTDKNAIFYRSGILIFRLILKFSI